ncbi:MAG: Holliday junction branch migration DNA helicase RuvB [Phycisphaerae bacterium]
MTTERIISSHSSGPGEDTFTNSLRPQRLREMIGQKQVIEKLTIAIDAARARGEPLEHILLDGPPGLGKTTLAHVIANEMKVNNLRITSGPSLAKQADVLTILTQLDPGDILFIDEVHRLPKIVEEFLYPAMEDFRVDFTIEGGLSGRVVNFALKPYTLIGATTRVGLLSAAMRDRFGHQQHLDFYSAAELATIIERSAVKLDIRSTDGALKRIASRSRGTPRVANRLLKRVRDYAQVRADGTLTPDVVEKALEIQQVDSYGLDELDRAFLEAIIKVYNGGPAGIEAIAATMGQERDTLEDVVEPYLLQIGFVIRTRQGRLATEQAYEHLGIPKAPTDDPDRARSQHTLF